MKKENRMFFGNIRVRSFDAGGKKTVEGLIPYDSKSVPIWGVTEIIGRTAFKKTLADGSEVRALWNHNHSHVLGSTKSGTLTLENTENGLVCRCELPDTSYANDLYIVIERGDVTAMSFGFTPVKWTYDREGDTRTLKEVYLHEVSFGVCDPAYPESTSKTYMRGLEKRGIDIERLGEALEKDEFREEDREIIKRAAESLAGLLGGKESGDPEPAEATRERTRTEPAEATPERDGGSETPEDTDGILLAIEAEVSA